MTTTTKIDTLIQLEWLAAQGARFALPRGRTKKEFETDWTNKPHTLKDAIRHAGQGGNVGILTGAHSDNIIALDRDIHYPGTIAMLGELGQTAKIVRNNAPDRGKLLYRIVGNLPPTTSWKERPSDRHPAAELLANGRHALAPPSEFEGGAYLLMDEHYGILELTTAEIEHVWRLITGETFDKKQHKSAGNNAGDAHREAVRAAWPTLKIFEYHGLANNGTQPERNGETRVLGNGGLLIADNGQWYAHGDSVGGDEFDAWSYSTERRIIDRADKTHFPRILASMAEAAGIAPPRDPRLDLNWPKVHTNGASAEAATEAPRVRIMRTDLGNARRMIAQHGADLRFVYAWDRWLIWDGTRWQIDETGEIERRAKQTVMSIYREAAQCEDDAERKEIVKHAVKSEGRSSIANMIALAKSEPGIPIRHTELDADPWLLNVKNGTISLKNGELQPHKRENLITKLATVDYDLVAKCARVDRFFDRIFAGDKAMIDYMWRAIGYSLTGVTTEHKMFFAHGGGNNGKSTFFEMLAGVMGDYWQKAPTEMIMRKHNDGGVPNDVARLVGARMVVCAEIEDGQKLAESKVKDLTGGDRLVARFMRAEYFEFDPTHKLWLYGNHQPEIVGTDNGIWRRIDKAPFTVTIPKEEINPNLLAELLEEAPGILARAVAGCLDWQQGGLRPPPAVTDATQEYRNESDLIGAFLSECTTAGEWARVQAGKLYKAYCAWCEQSGEKPNNNTRFGRSMVERGVKKTFGRLKFYEGIALIDDDQPE